MAVEILDLDTASPVDRVRLLGAKSRIHGRMAVPVQIRSRRSGDDDGGPGQISDEVEGHSLEGNDAINALGEDQLYIVVEDL